MPPFGRGRLSCNPSLPSRLLKKSLAFADNLASADLKLDADDRAKLDVVSRPNLAYPYWHQAWSASDRLGPADLSLIGKYLEKKD